MLQTRIIIKAIITVTEQIFIYSDFRISQNKRNQFDFNANVTSIQVFNFCFLFS